MRPRVSFIAFFLLLLAASAAMAQQQPPPGTAIDNQAEGFHMGPRSLDSVLVKSNKVHALIKANRKISMGPNHQRSLRKSQSFSFTHKLINTGNVPVTVTIRVANATGDDYDLEHLGLSGGNKTDHTQLSTAAPSVSSTSFRVKLQPADFYTFRVSATVPNSAKVGQRAGLRITAQTDKGKIMARNTDVLQVLAGPMIKLHKEALTKSVKQGDRLTYQITGRNSGDQNARAYNITVDGSQRQKVVLRDQIPVNTTFYKTVDTGRGQALYHIIGHRENSFVSKPPSKLARVDAFAVALDSLAPGERFNARFTLTVNANAAGVITNVATFKYHEPDANKQVVTSTSTNVVTKTLPKYDASIDYYSTDKYSDISRVTELGSHLRLQANAAACNKHVSRPDTTIITLTSRKTGDVETVIGIETGPNTGLFRLAPPIPITDAANQSVTKNDGIMQTKANDVITAALTACKQNKQPPTTQIVVSPRGIIFNSKTAKPVADVTITLVKISGGAAPGQTEGTPAKVYGPNGKTQVDNPQTTGPDGQFDFPYVKPGSYRIKVKTPAGYRFASAVAAANLPSNYTIDKSGSYGKEFTVKNEPGPVAFDVPVDPATHGTLFIKKSASVTSAQIGDFISYQLTVENNADGVARNVYVEDTLPFGFRYQKGSTKIDGKSTADPKGGKGPSLRFSIPAIEGHGSVKISYRVLLGAGVRNGDATNTAVAGMSQPVSLSSNTAKNTVKVRGGVFSDKGFIVGKVFSDCNGNHVQDPGEGGVPGVRLYLENGNYVISDSEGKYTFYGIIPTMHILKLDNYSLPKGSKLRVLDNGQAMDPSSRFVDLKKGQMQRADFAICNCDSTIQRQITVRRKALQLREGDEINSSVKRNLSVRQQVQSRDVKRAQASGVVNGEKDVQRNTQSSGLRHSTDSTASAPTMVSSGTDTTAKSTKKATNLAHQVSLEKVMIHEKAKLGFINLHNNDTLKTAKTRVRVKSRMGVSLQLKVNGKKIGSDRIGKKGTLAPTHLQAYEYVGIVLKPGKNTLTISQTDHFGNPRGSKKITVFAPGKVSALKLTVIKNDVSADGSSAAVVRVQLVDKNGLPITERLPITLDVSIGKWLTKDAKPSKPGLQTFIENGSKTFKLQSPVKPQDAKVRASFGTMQQEAMVHFLPDLRPLIAAGIIQGTIRLNDGASIVPARSADRFERELKSLSYRSGDATAEGRVAFFLKGKIKGNMLLTAGFNSEKDNDRLFRDIQPDKFYPVYGESSVKGYDAQSSSRLYVRVDHKRTYALYGDFITQDRSPARKLGAYNRTQTGIKLHYEKEWGSVNIFGSQTTSAQRIQIIRGRGISGPYHLNSKNILVNSEKIQIITRDRNQPSRIIKEKDLQRFKDYVIEPFTGNLIFKEPVRSLDKNLNPIYIRATYEVEDGGGKYLLGGGDGEFKLTPFWQVGGSLVYDQNPEDNYHLKSLNSTLKITDNTSLTGEVAESNTDLSGKGRAKRLELEHRGDKLTTNLYAGKADKNFVNRSSQLRSGNTEAGARGVLDVASSTKLKGEFIYSKNDTLDNYTTGGKLDLQHRFGKNLKGRVGFRYSKQHKTPAGNSSTKDIVNKNVRSKLTLGIPKVEGASVYGEYEQNINKSDRRLIAAGGSYRLNNIGRLYVRHEFISSAVGAYRLDSNTRRQNTVAGIDADFLGNGKIYSEYRVKDALDGADAQAAIGLKNRFKIREGFGVDAGIERIFSLTGTPADEGTSITTGIDYTANPLWKGTARAEAHFGHNSNSYFSSLGYGRKINPNWTFLGKNVFNLQTASQSGARPTIQQRARLGFAYRQTNRNQWDALGRYEIRYEQNGQLGDDYQRLVHIFSSNLNFHPNAKWQHSLRLAAKKVGETSSDFDSKSLTMLLSAHSMYNITRKLDGGVNASIMTDAGFGSKDYGAGIEAGYLVHRNLRLAVGFNVFGFSDPDLAASKYTRKGVYLGFSYKFDERLFRGLMPNNDKNKQLYRSCSKCRHATKLVYARRLPQPQLIDKDLQAADVNALPLHSTTQKLPVKLPKNIHFATDKSALGNTSRQMLDLVANFLKGQQTFKLEILGHTDSRGSYNYNLKLSEQRARAVRRYLIGKGVSPHLLKEEGLSEKGLLVQPEEDDIDRAQNRRVDFKFGIPSVRLWLIPQINDLQVGKQPNKNIPGWDYIFNTQIHAVPDCIHVQGKKLNAVTQYLLNRILMALHHHTKERVVFKLTGDHIEAPRKMIQSYLNKAGANMKQFDFITAGHASAGHGKITIDYGQNTNLKPIAQRDDYKLAHRQAVPPLLPKMMKLLKMRQDYSLMKRDDK